MEKEFISVEDIISSANFSTNDFRVDGKFLIISVVPKLASNKNPYFRLVLKDKTGSMRAIRFTKGDEEFKTLEPIFIEGNIIEILGMYQHKWDSMKINNERLLKSHEIELNEFEEVSETNVDELISTLMETIDLIQNKYLKKLLLVIFSDDEIRQTYFECPASVGMHHSYKNGNLDHTVSMIRMFQTLVENYEKTNTIDIDLVYTGIILHDIGKTKEYSIKNSIPTRNRGYGLIGHLSLGEDIVLHYVRQIKDFPEHIKQKLRHLILSHHGKREYGSPVEPQFLEAEILHQIDALDAKYKGENF